MLDKVVVFIIFGPKYISDA